ncbi:lysoplasmalogenase [Occultella glacieicola]|uniref:Lysoplasmalogenase n=1 Tax=Occultella glacieicola TaxID=2518684 RepID=A0ABY2E165_9MICO|nr:lysoplasmalogenase [Occultella glacieicola]TDE88937.1 lysoplasmalogenase [Occultella glacieicola]
MSATVRQVLRRLSPRTQALFGAYVAVGSVHLTSRVVESGALPTVSQILLMPALAAAFGSAVADLGGVRRRTAALMTAGLVASWVGDTVPRFVTGDAGFLGMVGGFLVAQACYLAAFAPYVAGAWRRRPAPVLAAGAVFGASFAALTAWCLPEAGFLGGPVVCYGLLLAAMATASTTVNRTTAVGGALFFVSDALIALNTFAPWYFFGGHHLVVMSTYLVAQALLAAGVVGALGAAEPDAATEAAAEPTTEGAADLAAEPAAVAD